MTGFFPAHYIFCEQRAMDDGKCHVCQVRMSVKVMRQFLTEEQVRSKKVLSVLRACIVPG